MKDIQSDKLMDAMLEHQLEGNEIKMLIAYVRLGGWKAGAEIFLPEATRKSWNISDKTAQRMRKSLVAKGWLIPTGNKSRFGCDKYMVTIPRVGQNDQGRSANMTSEVGQNDLSGRSIRPVEVTKEVTKEVPKKVTKTEPVADAPDSLKNENFSNKEELDLPASPMGKSEAGPSTSPMDEENQGVGQIDRPSSATQNEAFPIKTEEEKIQEYLEWKAKQPKPEPKAPVEHGGLAW